MEAFNMVLCFLVSMLLAFGSVGASHWPREGGDIMSPEKYVSGRWTAYLKGIIQDYNKVNGTFDGVKVDLPSYLYHEWYEDADPADMSCDITEDCYLPPFSGMKHVEGAGNEALDEYNRQGRYAILKSISVFHKVHRSLHEDSLESQLTAQGSVATLAQQYSWAKSVDKWRDEDAKRRALVAHSVLAAELTILPLISFAFVGAGPLVSAGVATLAGSMGGAWAGTTSLMTDKLARSEHRSEHLVDAAEYWLAQRSHALRMTAEFNLRHLFNGGDLSGYDLADFTQFGSFLQRPNELQLKRVSTVMETSMLVDRLMKEDRVYILDVETTTLDLSGTKRCRDSDFTIAENINAPPSEKHVVEDVTMVCVDEEPYRTYFVYALPKDPEGQAAVQGLDGKGNWYPPEGKRRVRRPAGKDLITKRALGFGWEDVVRSSLKSWSRSADHEGNNAALFNESLQHMRNEGNSAVFTLPICRDPPQNAIYQGTRTGRTMPMGAPCRCGEGLVSDDIKEQISYRPLTNRYLNELGFPNQYDMEFKSDSHENHGGIQSYDDETKYVIQSCGNEDQNDLFKCHYNDMNADQAVLESCSFYGTSHGEFSHGNGGRKYYLPVPEKELACQKNMPRDAALGGIPLVQIGYDGCPVLRNGSMVYLDLESGYRDYDWDAGRFIV